MVSVCIDVYNYGRFLSQAVESVLEQSLSDIEVIISDDCSTDDSFEAAQRYARLDSRVTVHQNARNLGMIGNRNAGLALAKGECS